MTLRPNLFHGGVRVQSATTLPEPSLEIPLFGLRINIGGDVATVTGPINLERELHRRIQVMADHLPHFLSGALKEPVLVEGMSGVVDGLPFDVHAAVSSYLVFTATDPEADTAGYFVALNSLGDSEVHRVSAAYRYLNQAFWLSIRSASRTVRW